MSDRYIRTSKPIEEQLASALKECEEYKSKLYTLKLQLDLRDKELAEARNKAQHFDILMSAVKDNEVVRGTWDKFMMALRLAGYDGTQ